MISQGDMNAVALTMRTGSTSRVPKTATAMPQVRKRFRQIGGTSRSTFALTTALSKESVTSRTIRMATVKSAANPPKRYATRIAASTTTTGTMKKRSGSVFIGA